MLDYRKLIRILETEVDSQEKLLKLLTKERVAIVKLQKEELDKICVEKESIFREIKELEQKREVVFSAVQNQDSEVAVKLKDIIEACPIIDLKKSLAAVREELFTGAEQVKELNNQNGQLIKSALGLISSTLSIMNSDPGSELPTYNQKGALTDDDDPAFTYKRPVTRQA